MIHSLQIRLFGTPIVQVGTESLRLGASAQALLYYLAAEAQPQSRTQLAGLLWSETDDDLARTSLRRTLSDLRKEVGEVLVSDYQTVALKLAACALDLTLFQQGVMQAATLDLTQLQAALEHYRGDFLQGFFLRNAPDFEHWVVNRRTYYRDLAVNGWQTLATRSAQQGDLTQAISAARRLLTLESWHEPTHRSLMRWLAQSGQRAAALTQFESCRRQLAAELDVPPSTETLALYAEIRAGQVEQKVGRQGNEDQARADSDALLQAFTPHSAFRPPISNLPPQPTPFVGRQEELADVQQRLTDPSCRLLTLVGPGGMGKTRLALEAAKAISDSVPPAATHSQCATRNSQISHFPDGIFFVPLAAVSTPSAVVTAIAEAMTLIFHNNLQPRQQLLSHLANKKLLLLLDNVEHLLAGIDLFAEILHGAPGVTLLVTSREVLNLQEEWLYPVGGLALPMTEMPQEAQLLTSDALQLFAQAALRALPTFNLAAEWRCALRICRQVDGMPLGIELAATWLRTLTCSQIANEIQRSLDFLASRQRNLPERHRSMRAVFEYSWQLLTTAEQQALRRLSILRGFCQEGAAEVAAASLFTLATLAEKSFIQVVRNEGHGRYVIHELLRQFAAEKLQADATEHTLSGERHSRYYLSRLAEEAQALTGAEQRRALTALQEESENIRTAWLWAAQHGQGAELEQSLADLYLFYSASHRYPEGIELLEATLRPLTPTVANADRLIHQLHNRLGGFYANLGRFDRAQSLLTTGLALAERLEWVAERAFCWQILGEMAGWTGNFAQGLAHLRSSLTLYRELGNPAQVAHTLARLTEFAIGVDDYATAIAYGGEYLTIARQLGNQRFVAHALRMLAYNLFSLGDFRAAVDYCREGLRLAEANGDQLELSLMLSLDLLNSTMGTLLPLAVVKEQSQRALLLVQASGQRYYVAVQLYLLAQILTTYQELPLAQPYCEEGIGVAHEVQATAIAFACQAVLGGIQCQCGDLHTSRNTLLAVLQLRAQVPIPKFICETLFYCAELLLAEAAALTGEAALAKQHLASQVLHLLTEHPSCLANFQRRAREMLTTLAAKVPAPLFATAQAQGSALTLEAVVREIVAQWEVV